MKLGYLLASLALAVSAFAQPGPGNPFTCSTNIAVTPIVRVEGITEQVGDLLLQCTGGAPVAPGTQIPQAKITIFLNTNVTSRVLNPTGASEALLMIDEPGAASSQTNPNPAPQYVCPNIFGCTTIAPSNGTSPYSGAPTNPNVFQGTVSGNSVTFVGIPIDPPGTQSSRIFRITNVRANANGILPGNATAPGQITALISSAPVANGANPGASIDITNPTQKVANVQPSLQFSVQGQSFVQCPGVNGGQVYNPSSPTLPANVVLRFSELFFSALRRKNLSQDSTHINASGPATVIGQTTVPTESGTILNPAANGNPLIGQAGIGTPLFVQFTNIPTGLSIYTYSQSPMFLNGGTTPVGFAETQGGNPAPSNTLQFDRVFVPDPVSNSVIIKLDVVDTVDQTTALKTLNFQAGFVGTTQVIPGNLVVSGGYDATTDPTAAQNFAKSPTVVMPQFGSGVSYVNPLLSPPWLIAATIRGCPDAPATLTSLTQNPSASFTAPPGGPAFPGRFTLPWYSGGAPATNVKASLSPPTSNISVSVDQTTTPANVTLTAFAQTIPNNLSTTLVVSSSAGAVTVPVSLQTTSNSFIAPWAINNVASYLSGGVSPGEVIVAFANNEFGPVSPQLVTLDSANRLGNQIGDTQLFFDDVAARMYYIYDNSSIRQGQIAAFVPDSVGGKSQTVVKVVRAGVPGPGVTIPVLDATPGLSTADSSGSGPLAALNHDGTINGPNNPEQQGQPVQLFGTGFGETTPPIRDGAFNGVGGPLATLNLPIGVFINGSPIPNANIIYAGPAPSAPEGVSQFNILLPNGIGHGPVPIDLQVGDKGTRPGTTIFVK